ncbi:MAG TPA: trypsin-like peptidase domain-containing protein [Gaiellaceae bacterium]|nr:trypsin-like peptidase domain-containing protein [Gaiellaceae bacterium]
MRPGAVAAVALAAALVGGLVSLLIGDRTGLVDGATQTVVVSGDGAFSIDRRVPDSDARPLVGNGFHPAAIYRSRSAGVLTVYSYFDQRPPSEHAAQGSGFVVSKRGEILTSAHVVTTAGSGDDDPEGATRVFVAFSDGDRVPAKLVGWDLYDDVAVLRVDPRAHAIEPVPLGDSSRALVGEPVAAMGSPFGNENSLAVGIVSATHRSIESLTSQYTVADAIQTDAPITHGNSGGPLFDARGRVIGINAQIRSDSGQAEGVGFAIPINAGKRTLQQLVRNGRVRYAYVGVNAEDLTPTIARRFDYSVERGAVVACVVPKSPGADAGLRGGSEKQELNGFEFRYGGDVVVQIGNTKLQDADDLVRVVSESLFPGQVVDFTIVRGGRRLVLPVRLGERPKQPTPQC